MNNNILTIQEMLMREMKRLDDNNYMKHNSKEEVARSNALSQDACTFVKTVNLGLSIMRTAEHNGVTKDSLNKELGVTTDEII